MSWKPKVLLVEDDDLEAQQVVERLTEFQIERVATATAARDRLKQAKNYDAVVLDLHLEPAPAPPAGLGLLELIHRVNPCLPVIMFTFRTDMLVRTLRMGADDYIRKPYDIEELEARIGAIIRRWRRGSRHLDAAGELQAGPLRLDRNAQWAWLEGEPLDLSPYMVELLDYMMRHPREVLSSRRLYDNAWNDEDPIDLDNVRRRVQRTCRALTAAQGREQEFIEALGARGWRFAVDVTGYGEYRPH